MNRGGGQRVLVNLINNLDSQKYDITVLAISDDGDLDTEHKEHIHYQAIVKSKNKILRLAHSFLVRRVIPPSIIARLYIRSDYNCEIAYLEGECTRLIAAHRVEKRKKLAWVHVNLMEITGSMDLFRSKEKALHAYNQFNHILCVSEGVKRAFFECFGQMNNVSVLYNVIDDKDIYRKAEETVRPWRGEGLNILMVGNFRKQKAYDRMMNICERLKLDRLHYTVTVLGGGSEFETINKMCHQKELTDHVHLLGPVSNPYPYMKEADVLVCSSIQEGFSTVVIEALLLGLPTITTECSGMSEILDNGKYGIITNNDEDSLYQSVKKVINSPEILDEYRRLLPERIKFFSTETRITETEKFFE
jgi:glycosyltransferase involved in cell wall biosynthesis